MTPLQSHLTLSPFFFFAAFMGAAFSLPYSESKALSFPSVDKSPSPFPFRSSLVFPPQKCPFIFAVLEGNPDCFFFGSLGFHDSRRREIARVRKYHAVPRRRPL